MTNQHSKLESKTTGQDAPSQVKSKQMQNLSMVLIVLMVIVGGLLFLLAQKSQHHQTKASKGTTVHFADAIDENAVYKASIDKFQSQVANTQANEAKLNQDLNDLATQNAKTKKMTQAMLVQKYQALSKELNALQASVKNQTAKQFPVKDSNHNDTHDLEGASQGFPTLQGGNFPKGFEPKGAMKAGQGLAVDGNDILSLAATPVAHTSTVPLMNPNSYVPAGTHVLGVLLQGADLVADSYNQQNPKPILIRLIGYGSLPNHHLSHLKNCVVTAAMTGDISSSRGDVRLERLSCVRPDHSIIDVPVYGTVATHAKEGIAGQTYSREGDRIGMATGSGIAAGIANGVSQKYVDQQQSIYGPVGTISNANLLKYGIGQGLGTGLNTLSNFEMNRAKAIYPIIQVNAGKLVTVTFLKGFFFDSQANTQRDERDKYNPWVKTSIPKNALPTSAQMVASVMTGDQS